MRRRTIQRFQVNLWGIDKCWAESGSRQKRIEVRRRPRSSMPRNRQAKAELLAARREQLGSQAIEQVARPLKHERGRDAHHGVHVRKAATVFVGSQVRRVDFACVRELILVISSSRRRSNAAADEGRCGRGNTSHPTRIAFELNLCQGT